jgi:phenylalanine-4-hydroxylase
MPKGSLDRLPLYLRKYCSEQNYNKYSPRDHAAWRFIMRQSREYFKQHAVPIYVEGLKKTGIPLDRIPKISEMDAALQEFGWGAVAVQGFIPPIAFLELQSRKILPIATDMRNIHHLAYTPAPDIVHEAAGHAPIIADADYRDYLTQYAGIAHRCIMSREDLDVYEAIRVLSDAKENPDMTKEDIEFGQKKLDIALKSVSFVSEAAKVSRMAWWTVEYGLVGPLKNPKIYGAGLLSSVGESQNCLLDRVRKIPLTVKCVQTSYDITEPQPQLFVAESLGQLTSILHELKDELAYVKGGFYGVEEARKARTVNTIELSSGIQISGVLNRYEAKVGEKETDNEIQFLGFSGPVQICFGDRELENQSKQRHPTGFSSPLGRYRGCEDKVPEQMSDQDLGKIGLVLGQYCEIRLVNGFRIMGVPLKVQRSKDGVNSDGRLLYISWTNCTVRRGSVIYFDPSWGEFDLVFGESVRSVFGGPADRDAFGEYETGGISTQPGRTSPYSQHELRQFESYAKIGNARVTSDSLQDLAVSVLADPDADWLVKLELVESQSRGAIDLTVSQSLAASLREDKQRMSFDDAAMIDKGLALVSVPD